MKIVGVVTVLAALAGTAVADPKGVIPQDVLDNPRAVEWFKQAKIAACCAEADGYAISQYSSVDNHYIVPDPDDPAGPWLDVPPAKVVADAKNITGYAWLWLYPHDAYNAGEVRCFVPNGDT